MAVTAKKKPGNAENGGLALPYFFRLLAFRFGVVDGSGLTKKSKNGSMMQRGRWEKVVSSPTKRCLFELKK